MAWPCQGWSCSTSWEMLSLDPVILEKLGGQDRPGVAGEGRVKPWLLAVRVSRLCPSCSRGMEGGVPGCAE